MQASTAFGRGLISDSLPQNFLIGPIHRPERHEITLEPVISLEHPGMIAEELPFQKNCGYDLDKGSFQGLDKFPVIAGIKPPD